MISLTSFRGEVGRRAYAIAAPAAFLSQHLVVAAAFAAEGRPLPTPWWFWLTPMRSFLNAPFMPPPALLAAMAATLAADWVQVSLAFRRAQGARAHGGLATLAVVPGLQILVMAWLAVAPGRPAPEPETEPSPPAVTGRATPLAIVQGMLAGAALSVAAVFLGAVVLKTYGLSLFLFAPFLIGLASAFLANRRGRIGTGATMLVVMGALGLGALALLGVALEGVVCIVIASPLIAVAGVLGGLLGEALAVRGRDRGRATASSVAVLPLLMLVELAAPPHATFTSAESIDVGAPPAAVWDSIVHMGPIPGGPAAPFRWGLAYPVRGVIYGSGVGAVRLGVFSTGKAYERVTEWRPDRRLTFIVLSDPPTMRELSPYAHVDAPHVKGYFRTTDARFDIEALPGGRSRLTLTTHHELDLEPALYWTPIAQWAVHANKRRVLAHFAAQAERWSRTTLATAARQTR
ncbi:MAG TPA: hypothetical protein VG939_15755 [Caulobacteraceae bacterium]|nr:hypothetical protein [Caulobacteraceae bacterium]